MIRYLFLLLPFLLLAQAPRAFNALGEAIDKERLVFISLANHPKLNRYRDHVNSYCKVSGSAFERGYKLDKAIEEAGGSEKKLKKIYLKDLRALKKHRNALKKFYFQEVTEAMQSEENTYLLFLIENAKELLDENAVLKAKVLTYALEVTELKKHQCIKTIKAEKELDDRSYTFTQKLQEESKAFQDVLKHHEALKLRNLLVEKKKGGVIVYAKEQKGDISFVIENLFEMHVSATLYIEDIKGYKTETTLPYKLVLKPKEKRKVLTLHNDDINRKSGYFNSHISWSKGDVNAEHNGEFIYALPFHESYKVSQGFNGNTSHKGNAKYAVDFKMPVGTPVYASRGGKIVEIVQHHNKHGMSLAMRQYANYVIVEHEDRTLGRYFHLKHRGVKVKLGAKVKQGELLGLSGNTGRTSGAHLHFVVTKAEEYRDGYKSSSIPVKFLCSEGVLDKPVKGDTYCTTKNE